MDWKILMYLSTLLVILMVVILFFGRKRLGDLADDLRDVFNKGPRGRPPTHPLPVTGRVEVSGAKDSKNSR